MRIAIRTFALVASLGVFCAAGLQAAEFTIDGTFTFNPATGTFQLEGDIFNEADEQVGEYSETSQAGVDEDCPDPHPALGFNSATGAPIFTFDEGTITAIDLSCVESFDPETGTVYVETFGTITGGTGDFTGASGTFKSETFVFLGTGTFHTRELKFFLD